MLENEKIKLDYGSGGLLTDSLIKELFLKIFDNKYLSRLDDSAIFKIGKNIFAFTTDSYVVNPIFFPGGDIGKLAVCGTINDLAVMGAKPLFLSCGLIIEEGLEMNVLKKIVQSMQKVARENDVQIITGDTKVVNKGTADKIFINTSGIGIIEGNYLPHKNKIKPDDEIIISGYIGDHGIAVLTQREGFKFNTNIKSDCASCYNLIRDVMSVSKNIKFMRDPTRGGLATVLCEICELSGYSAFIKEQELPIRKGVKGICEILGFDPLYIANEGKVVFVVDKKDSKIILNILRKNKLGKSAKIIGKILDEKKAKLYLETQIGGTRIIEKLYGDQLPRIC